MDPSGTYTDREPANPGQASDVHSNEPRHAAEVYLEGLTSKHRHGWRNVVLNFTPSWFSATMGTGIVSILLHNLPYNGIWLYWLSVILFGLNVLLFVVFSLVSLLRYTMYPGLFMMMIQHPVQSLFVGTFPMGLITIIDMIIFVCVPAWGDWAAVFAWTLWWIDIAVALACCMWLPFIIMHIHDSELSKMTAAWLIPIVTTIVAAASGGIIAEVLPNPQHALWTVITSYVLLGTGFPLAMVVLVMYFHRLSIYRLPPREVIVSVFLPLGPLGQGGFALMQLGKVCMQLFARTDTIGPESGRIVYTFSIIVALILWGYGLVWLFFALASISRSRFPFNMGWWGFTFPLGVFASSASTLGKELPSLVFKVVGTILSICVVFLWMVVASATVKGAVTGTLFNAPCAASYEQKLVEERRIRCSRQGSEDGRGSSKMA